MSALWNRPSEESHYEGTEPVRGLPARLPAGETMLWQGAPAWRSLAIRSFHLRKITIYFAALLAWDVFAMLYYGESWADKGPSLINLAGLAVVALGLIAGFCWLVERTTVYTITTHRILIRAGLALPKTINIPFGRMASVGLKLHSDGSGDLLITPVAEDHIAYLLLWPHVQALQVANARPMLRSVPEATKVARLLGDAMASESVVVPHVYAQAA